MSTLPFRNSEASFTRPANTTAYASGDLVANDTDAADVVPLSFTVSSPNRKGATIVVWRGRLKKSGTSVTNASFRLHLYATSPTVTNGDNGAWASIVADYLGYIDIAVDKAFSDASQGDGVPLSAGNAAEMIVQLPAGGATIYGLLEARAAYTPGSAEVFTATLETAPLV